MINTEKKRKILLITVPYILMFIFALILLVCSIGFKRDTPTIKEPVIIKDIEISVNNGPYIKTELPLKISNLESATPVSLHTVITPDSYDGVYIKTRFSKAEVFLDNKSVFTFGKDENYPAFMKDPATEIHIVETYGENKPVDLRIEYKSPTTIPTLILEPLMLGTSKELILEKSIYYGLSWIFSLVQIIAGISLILISLFLRFIDKNGILFIWLGIFSVVTGLWFFGVNDFAITVFPDSAFLYLSAYVGFVLFLPTLLRFMNTAVDFTNPKCVYYLEGLTVAVGIIAFILQFTGIMPLHITKYLSNIIMFPIMFILTGMIIREIVVYNNTIAKRFILPMCLFIIGIFSDIFIKLVMHWPVYFPSSQIGTILFLLIMEYIVAMTVKDNVTLQRKEKELAFEKKLLDIQNDEQRASRLLLVENEKLLSRQRHDLRHHLAAIQTLVKDDNDDLKNYLNTVIEKIPGKKVTYCENNIVNAIVSHFASECDKYNIRFQSKLVVPETGVHSIDSDLCVIFANLLENATEACKRMTTEDKFITIRSSLQFDTLTITMDNSYDGNLHYENGFYYSSKRNEVGTGLISIQSIAKEYHGSSRFKPRDNIFESSVYINLK